MRDAKQKQMERKKKCVCACVCVCVCVGGGGGGVYRKHDRPYHSICLLVGSLFTYFFFSRLNLSRFSPVLGNLMNE